MTTRQQRRAEARKGAGRRMAEDRDKEIASRAWSEIESSPKEQRKPNRAERRCLGSQRFRRTHLNRTDAEGDDLDKPAIVREVRQSLNHLKRVRRDNRIRNGAREARGGPDPQYNEKTDTLVLTHVTKGQRNFSRRRLELQAKMQRLLNPKLYRGLSAEA